MIMDVIDIQSLPLARSALARAAHVHEVPG